MLKVRSKICWRTKTLRTLIEMTSKIWPFNSFDHTIIFNCLKVCKEVLNCKKLITHMVRAIRSTADATLSVSCDSILRSVMPSFDLSNLRLDVFELHHNEEFIFIMHWFICLWKSVSIFRITSTNSFAKWNTNSQSQRRCSFDFESPLRVIHASDIDIGYFHPCIFTLIRSQS